MPNVAKCQMSPALLTIHAKGSLNSFNYIPIQMSAFWLKYKLACTDLSKK